MAKEETEASRGLRPSCCQGLLDVQHRRGSLAPLPTSLRSWRPMGGRRLRARPQLLRTLHWRTGCPGCGAQAGPRRGRVGSPRAGDRCCSSTWLQGCDWGSLAGSCQHGCGGPSPSAPRPLPAQHEGIRRAPLHLHLSLLGRRRPPVPRSSQFSSSGLRRRFVLFPFTMREQVPVGSPGQHHQHCQAPSSPWGWGCLWPLCSCPGLPLELGELGLSPHQVVGACQAPQLLGEVTKGRGWVWPQEVGWGVLTWNR